MGFPGCPVVKNPPANAGVWVWCLVGEDPSCLRATTSVCQNYWVHVLQTLKPTCLEPVLQDDRSYYNGELARCNEA